MVCLPPLKPLLVACSCSESDQLLPLPLLFAKLHSSASSICCSHCCFHRCSAACCWKLLSREPLPSCAACIVEPTLGPTVLWLIVVQCTSEALQDSHPAASILLQQHRASTALRHAGTVLQCRVSDTMPHPQPSCFRSSEPCSQVPCRTAMFFFRVWLVLHGRGSNAVRHRRPLKESGRGGGGRGPQDCHGAGGRGA